MLRLASRIVPIAVILILPVAIYADAHPLIILGMCCTALALALADLAWPPRSSTS